MLLAEEEQTSASGKDLFENGKELMMIATRQYARRQTKWIRQRFLRSDRYIYVIVHMHRAIVRIYLKIGGGGPKGK